MPIIGRQCTYDVRTVCLRMSEATLPVNQDGPGLTLVYGWASEERRAQGTSPSVQGIVFNASSGKVLPLSFCPWCGVKIVSGPTSVRTHSPAASPAAAPPRQEEGRQSEAGDAAPASPPPRAARARAAAEAAPAPAAQPTPPAPRATSLKAIREQLGLSQAELGEKLGLARSSIANYENGRAPLSQRLLKWMAKREEKMARSGR